MILRAEFVAHNRSARESGSARPKCVRDPLVFCFLFDLLQLGRLLLLQETLVGSYWLLAIGKNLIENKQIIFKEVIQKMHTAFTH